MPAPPSDQRDHRTDEKRERDDPQRSLHRREPGEKERGEAPEHHLAGGHPLQDLEPYTRVGPPSLATCHSLGFMLNLTKRRSLVGFSYAGSEDARKPRDPDVAA